MERKFSFPNKRSMKQAVLPPLVGLIVMAGLYGLFNFQRIAAEVRYIQARSSPQPSFIANDVDKNQPSQDKRARVVVAKLGIDAPVLYDATSENEVQFQQLLNRGVVHYPFTALPGETGNVVLFGHSSGSWLHQNTYQSIFSTLDKLTSNDQIDVYYQGFHYRYRVHEQKIVSPYEVSVLQPTKHNQLTLITCYPIGSWAKRLIVTAYQTDY